MPRINQIPSYYHYLETLNLSILKLFTAYFYLKFLFGIIQRKTKISPIKKLYLKATRKQQKK